MLLERERDLALRFFADFGLLVERAFLPFERDRDFLALFFEDFGLLVERAFFLLLERDLDLDLEVLLAFFAFLALLERDRDFLALRFLPREIDLDGALRLRLREADRDRDFEVRFFPLERDLERLARLALLERDLDIFLPLRAGDFFFRADDLALGDLL